MCMLLYHNVFLFYWTGIPAQGLVNQDLWQIHRQYLQLHKHWWAAVVTELIIIPSKHRTRRYLTHRGQDKIATISQTTFSLKMHFVEWKYLLFKKYHSIYVMWITSQELSTQILISCEVLLFGAGDFNPYPSGLLHWHWIIMKLPQCQLHEDYSDKSQAAYLMFHLVNQQ